MLTRTSSSSSHRADASIGAGAPLRAQSFHPEQLSDWAMQQPTTTWAGALALAGLLARFRRIELAADDIRWHEIAVFRGPKAVPLALGR